MEGLRRAQSTVCSGLMTMSENNESKSREEEAIRKAIEHADRTRKKTAIVFNSVDDWYIYTHGNPRLPFDDWLISVKFLLRGNIESQTLTFPVRIARRLISTLTTELGLLEKHWEDLPVSLKRLHKELAEKSAEESLRAEQEKTKGDLGYIQ